jgi:hypothetical protein
MSFSLFSRLTPINIAALLVFAISTAAALFLILELSQPFVGLVQISSTPLRYALAPLKQKRKMSWFGRKGHLRSQIVGTMADQSRSGHPAEQRISDG